MEACFGAFNTKGFSSSLDNYQLPSETHLTYSGLFNQMKFTIGPKAKKPLELHLGYARAQNSHSLYDSNINNYLTIFTKGSKDGEDRDDRILNSMIVLDISGSMGSGLTSTGQGCRIQLAKEAILMFISKLRPNDAFGLVVFNNSGKTVIPIQRVSQLNIQEVAKLVRQIHPQGGTTLMSGFDEAYKQLKGYLEKNQFAKNNFENRFIMLTDVCDNSISQAQNFIAKVESSNIHTTVIGISDEFKSQVCESLIEVKGFNYFCATELNDLKRYLFENFSFTFFPANYDIQLSIESDQIQSIQVFGTVDAEKVSTYNQNPNGKFIITRTKSSFPSELQISENGQVKTYGGLMLIKLKLKDNQSTIFDGKIQLTHTTSTQFQQIREEYPVHYESPANEQFFSDQSLYEAISIFFYGYESKNILKEASQSNKGGYQRYIKSLEELKESVPESKKEELMKLIDTLKEKQKRERQGTKDPMAEY